MGVVRGAWGVVGIVRKLREKGRDELCMVRGGWNV